MGDPKKKRKLYSTPRHPWQKDRILEEKEIKKTYGLKNKTEVWKMKSLVGRAQAQAKQLISSQTEQGEKEKQLLLQRLSRFGMVAEDATLNDILGLKPDAVLERRLQTIIVRKGYARSMKQARQFITHGHILVGDKKITFPSFLVPKGEESSIIFNTNSSLAAEDHPEREKVLSPEEVAIEAKKKDAKKAEEKKAAKKEEKKSEVKADKKEDKKTKVKEEPKKEDTKDEKKVEVKKEEIKTEEKVEEKKE